MKLFEYRKYSLKELAALYNKRPRSFTTWIEPIQEQVGPRQGWDYTPGQVKIIVNSFIGVPPGYKLPRED